MDALKRLLGLVKPHWWRLALAMACMGLVAACTSAVALMIKPLLDGVFFKMDPNTALEIIPGLVLQVEDQASVLKIIPGLVLLVYILKGVFFFGQAYFMNYVGNTIVNDLRVALYSHIQSLSLSFFHRNSTGVLISRITNDVNLVQGAVTTLITGTIMDVFTIVGLVFVVFYRDWKLATLGLFILPLAVYPIYHFGRRLKSLATGGQVVMGELTNIINETLQGARIVKAFNMEDHENNRFIRECRRVLRITMRIVNIRSISSQMMEALGGLCVAGIIWYGGYQVVTGRATPGAFISFMTALLLLYEPIKRVTRMNVGITQGMAAAERIYEVLDTRPEITDRPGAVELPPVSREIEFRDVYFGYDDEGDVLRGINLKVRAGEVLAIVGVSGGGKTSLVNLIPRFYDVRRGALLLDGRDVRDVTLRSLRAQIAVVSQRVILFNDTVGNNIAYGSLDKPREDIEAAARAAYAHDFILATPRGYETVIGERGVRLSGGEQQRLAMARALLKNAPILILDEATSSLDTESELAVQKALENLMRGRTTFVIAHRLSTVRHADRIIVMSGGRIIEEGDHDALMALGGEYHRLYEMQFKVDDGLDIPGVVSGPIVGRGTPS
ncbi:MAG: ABC transporter transmembrane domain-containing protein [Thermodesulfobacteriota bacterium]